jgi:hypothetical protein
MEALQARRGLTVDGVRVTAIWPMADLYTGSRFERVWTDPKKVDDLLRAIADIERDGLECCGAVVSAGRHGKKQERQYCDPPSAQIRQAIRSREHSRRMPHPRLEALVI